MYLNSILKPLIDLNSILNPHLDLNSILKLLLYLNSILKPLLDLISQNFKHNLRYKAPTNTHVCNISKNANTPFP